MPAPKTVKPIVSIKDIKVEEGKLIIIFAEKELVEWVFECPSKRCATKWAQKIQEAVGKVSGNR